ncbi:MAG: ferrous iron transport protein A [Bifidobacteriaceae bacterium]|jgi:Fe2+ transport system protein FeoA|nr:ferrous iron transport protein A [Bifidobacteriaceae bacterium]
MAQQSFPLNMAPRGQRLRVTGITSRGPAAQRIAEMGLIPGCELKVLRVAPLGDPMDIAVRGYRLSLRKADVESILVVSADAAPAAVTSPAAPANTAPTPTPAPASTASAAVPAVPPPDDAASATPATTSAAPTTTPVANATTGEPQ